MITLKHPISGFTIDVLNATAHLWRGMGWLDASATDSSPPSTGDPDADNLTEKEIQP